VSEVGDFSLSYDENKDKNTFVAKITRRYYDFVNKSLKIVADVNYL